jgi:hypothetical protein
LRIPLFSSWSRRDSWSKRGYFLGYTFQYHYPSDSYKVHQSHNVRSMFTNCGFTKVACTTLHCITLPCLTYYVLHLCYDCEPLPGLFRCLQMTESMLQTANVDDAVRGLAVWNRNQRAPRQATLDLVCRYFDCVDQRSLQWRRRKLSNGQHQRRA